MISFKESIQSFKKSSDSNISDIYANYNTNTQQQQQESSDINAQQSSLTQRNVKRIFVFPRCYSGMRTKSSTSYNKSNRSSYEELTNSSRIPAYVQNIAATKIQSIVRRYLAIRKFYLYEKLRIANRNQIIEDALSKRSIILDKNLPKSQLSILEDRVKILRNQLKSPNISKETEKRILSIFFNCVAKGGIITLNDLVSLICDIINLPCKKSDFYNVYNNKTKFRPSDKISFSSFLLLFTSYKSTHVLRNRHWYNRIRDFFSSEDIPFNFLLKFHTYQTILYDVMYSLQKYDSVNPKLFSCKKCHHSSFTPMEFIHHLKQNHSK